jgi:hypothetical protein
VVVYYSHLSSYIEVPQNAQSQLLFPGSKYVPEDSLGFIRSNLAIDKSWKFRSGNLSHSDQCPFRDYPDEVLTNDLNLFSTPFDKNRIVITARNVMNECLYQARIGGKWWRRKDDNIVDEKFPVLTVSYSHGLNLVPLSEAVEKKADILTGLPIVIDSKPMTRDFLIANSSDISHSYECDPQNRFGPISAWQDISDEWLRQWEKRESLTESQRTAKIDAVANKHNDWPDGNYINGPPLPHSIILEKGDKNIYAMLLCGSLWQIANYLSNKGIKNAFVLDQSGSVRYSYLPMGGHTPKPIVSTTNYRGYGACFLVIETNGYVRQKRHMWLP